MEHTDDLEFQLNFLFQTAAEGIVLVDAGGLLTRINPAAAAMLRLSPANVLGQPVQTAFKRQPALIRLLRELGERQADITLPHKRLATGAAIDLPGGGRIALLHDVTERADLESRREVLVRAVAHDLRNPLNAVIGYVGLAAQVGELTSDQGRWLERAQQALEKLYALTESLIDLAWIEAGMALEHRPFELAHLIHDAAADLAPEAAERAITIALSTQTPVPTVIGDPRRIQQVIGCLLTNAVRYSPPLSTVAIHAWQDGPRVYCSVGDQGIGISENDLLHVWDRLWRSADERVRAIPGSGTGLTFARAIIERHGGSIDIESTLDVGTTVTFVLPLAEGW